MNRTKLCERLGMAVPIVQAPIGRISNPQLVAAVSDAGGPGMRSLTWRTDEETRQLVRAIKSLTTKPFGVNFVPEWNPASKLQICFEEGVKILQTFLS